MKTNRSISLAVLSVLVLFCVGFGIGIGIGAGIWKGSGTNELGFEKDTEWFFAQQAQNVHLLKASANSSDDVYLLLSGLSPVTVGLTDTPDMGNVYISNEQMMELITNDPEKNSMLVCDVEDSKLALPVTLNGGTFNSSNGLALYTATYIEFDASTWKHINESTQVNTSRLLRTEDDYLKYESCYLFIDGLWDFFDSDEKIKGNVDGMLAPFGGGVGFDANLLMGALKYRSNPTDENKKALEDYVDGALQGAAVDAVAFAAPYVGSAIVGGINTATASAEVIELGVDGVASRTPIASTGILGNLG